jgi:NAD(P)-dependent dehydrogenase (short-subunit alcohol dehydrogenase family)
MFHSLLFISNDRISLTVRKGNWEYTATKHGLKGFMRTARRSSWEQGIRINYVAPCWIKSAIRTREYEDWLTARGIEFGEQEDVANCMMRIATDRSVNGMCY